MIRVLDSQSSGSKFNTTGWLQSRFNLSSLRAWNRLKFTRATIYCNSKASTSMLNKKILLQSIFMKIISKYITRDFSSHFTAFKYCSLLYDPGHIGRSFSTIINLFSIQSRHFYYQNYVRWKVGITRMRSLSFFETFRKQMDIHSF